MTIKEKLIEIFMAGVKAVDPQTAVFRNLALEDNFLKAGEKVYDISKGRIFVAGAGKATAPMAYAIEKILKEKICKGVVVVKNGHGMPLSRISVIEAAHPVPDSAGEKGASEILDLVDEVGPDDLLICLFSGGASALLPAPRCGMDIDDLRQTTQLLLASGANISDINIVRKHLSRLAGGQLAKRAKGARVLSLIVSDVIGDDLAAIASGPTAPDDSSFSDALAVIAKFGLSSRVPVKARELLEAGARCEISDTPDSEDSIFGNVENVIVASNRIALEACARKAEELGYSARIADSGLCGEARQAAAEMVGRARSIAGNLLPEEKPVCLLFGGETTVTVKGPGLGGRNMEMALASASLIKGDKRISCLFGGTDGTDGPTNAAGGFAFHDTASKIGDCDNFLQNNDSYHALEEAGELFITGPTLTNVMDIGVIIIEAPQADYSRI